MPKDIKQAVILTLALALLAFFALACSDDDTDTNGDGALAEDGDLDSEAGNESVDADNDKNATEADIDPEPEAEPDLTPAPHGREVLKERIPGAECVRFPPPSSSPYQTEDWDCDGVDPPGCNYHSECTENNYGYCFSGYYENPCQCHYLPCMNDNECGEGEACLCSSQIFANMGCRKSCRSSAGCANGHKCVAANMRYSCGDGEVKEDIFADNYEIYHTHLFRFGKTYGYRCTSNKDECSSDHDCASNYYCVFDEDKQHFACDYIDLDAVYCPED